jgi:hypothetical protein
MRFQKRKNSPTPNTLFFPQMEETIEAEVKIVQKIHQKA